MKSLYTGTRPRRCWPVADWPPLDRAAWAAAQVPGDPLDPGGIAAEWAAVSRRQIERCYGRWLCWLDTRGQLDRSVPPAARATKEQLGAYLADLKATLSPFSVQSQVQMVGDALRAMAPDRDWRWIGRAAYRLRSTAVAVRNKRDRLQSPAALLGLGERLMAEADAQTPTLATALAFRNGLIIGLFALRPVRVRNLQMILCGEHLVQRSGAWWLLFTGAETKTKAPFEAPFPDELVAQLEHYLRIYRPILLTSDGAHEPVPLAALWVSRDATHLTTGPLAHMINRQTRLAFGVAVNPHLFRDCAATAIAIADPERVDTIATVLGHSSLATSERHYNQALGLEASRRYQETIARARDRIAKSGQTQRAGEYGA